MTDLNKTPMKAPDYRFFWWQDYTNFLRKAASNLENILSDEFRFNRYNEEPDNEAAVVNLIHSGLLALADIAQKQTDKNKINLSQYEDFCEYWVFGRGKWNGLQEFLQKEANS
ncbi:MAG: hypothetical protein IJR43_04610 [Synergistaceae bacterium]|nr:hypothetical protein [Synergistaceae bacterium]MBQ9628523.1 hypothetical protein [Synergistaceae bacterium]MBR0250668.1 hypothetical protein [Synergistaceae bacterium]